MSLRDYLRRWIADLSEPRDEFNGLAACPYAKGAALATCACEDAAAAMQLLSVVRIDMHSALLIELPREQRENAIIAIASINQLLETRDMVAFLSDPDEPIVVDGFRTTQRDRLLILLQRRGELRHARDALRFRGYYERWRRDDEARVL